MSLRGWRWAVVPFVAVLAIIGLGLAAGSPAQETKPTAISVPAAAAPPADDNYPGAETCKRRHEEQWNKLAKIRTERLFLFQACDAAERT